MIRIAATALALGLAFAGGQSLADDAMGKDKMGMSKDKASMKKDSMKKQEKMGMKKDAMGMKKEPMAKDAMGKKERMDR
jgi:pentapeptide MXKDX repeat protein